MPRSLLLCLAAFLAASAPDLHASKRKLSVDAETPAGALLKTATDETETAKRIALLEDFVAKHPSHESASWVNGELQALYLKSNDFDKAIASGEKVLAADPDDSAIVSNNLKAAEAKKDTQAIVKWASASGTVAARIAASPKPSAEEEAEAWKSSVEYAKQMLAYADYTLYVQALQATDPKLRIQIGTTLAKLNPKSEYNATLAPQLMAAYQATGDHARALDVAEQGLQSDPNNEDMLLYAASKYYEKKDKGKVVLYAKRLVDTLPAKPAPKGVGEEDWKKGKDLRVGIAHWMLGVTASNDQKWLEADQSLRAALPLIKDNKDLMAESLFHLGLANFKLGDPKGDKNRILDALRFNQQCSLLASPFQAQAKKNVAAIRSQYKIQ